MVPRDCCAALPRGAICLSAVCDCGIPDHTHFMKFQQLIKSEMLEKTNFLAFKLSYWVFIMLINVKMPTMVGISTFMSMINFMLSCVEHEFFITSESDLAGHISVITSYILRFAFDE